MKNIYTGLCLILLVFTKTQAAPPTWTVDAKNYSFDMTVTAVLNAQCTELMNASNMLGAFVNGEVRGVATSSNEVNGRFLVFMSVYSNVSSGETITFKIYDADTDTEIDAVTTLAFQDDAVNGSPSSPFEVLTNHLPEGLNLSNKSVNDNATADELVGAFSVVDQDVADVYTYSLVAGTGDTDNANFYITADELFTAQPVDFETQDAYSVYVRADNGLGCTIDSAFTIAVIDVNGVPTQIYLSSEELYENMPAGSLVGRLTSDDEDANEVFTYSLVTGTGDTDNGTFSIKNDSLLSGIKFNYETQSSYSVRIQVMDVSGNVYEQPFVITVLDTNEAPRAFDLSVDVIEDTDLGTVFATIGVYDEDQGQTIAYEIIETESEGLFSIAMFSGEVSLSGVLDYETKANYVLKIRVYDDGDPVLSDTVTVYITVIDAIEEGALPSVDYISPNGDGKNDTWQILNVEIYQDYQLIIFNASGLEVYSIDSGYSNDWGGMYDGKVLPTGTYYYVFMSNQDEKVFKGTISLVR